MVGGLTNLCGLSFGMEWLILDLISADFQASQSSSIVLFSSRLFPSRSSCIALGRLAMFS